MERSRSHLSMLFVAVVLIGCGTTNTDQPSLDVDGGQEETDAGTQPQECDVSAPTVCPDPKPAFADVQPIFQRRCVVCHTGVPNQPWPLTDYSHIADWQGEVRGSVLDCSMPPPDQNVGMTNEERVAILEWIRCGLPK